MPVHLIRLITGQICLHACMTGLRLAAPLLALRSGSSPAAVGFLLSLFALSQVFLALPAGRYANRHGLGRPMRLGVVTAMVGAGLAAIWPVYPVLCVAALMAGAATGVVLIALQRYVGRAVEGREDLRRAFSWLSIGPAASNFLGPFVAGLLIDASGFRAAFAFCALMPLACWALMRGTTELPPVDEPDDRSALRGAADMLAQPDFRRLLLVNWCLSACWDVHTFVVPLLGHELHLSASVIGTILGSFAVAATAIRLLLPIIAAHQPEWRMLMISMLAGGLILAVYPLQKHALALGLCSVLLGFALGSVQPMVMSLLHQITPEQHYGEALALRLMTINASSVAMPLLFGAVGAVVGAAGVFWATALAVTSGSRLAWGLRRLELGKD